MSHGRTAGGLEAGVTGAPALDGLLTPAAIVDLDRMDANLRRMAAYAAEHGLRLRPHTKTHKSPELAAEQVRHGAAGLTVAQLHEAAVMAAASDDILLAHPPVGAPKLARLFALPRDVHLTVAVDSTEAIDGLAAAALAARREVGVLVELDLGMHRVGVADGAAAVRLSRRCREQDGIDWRGIMFYPGHIREHISMQAAAIAAADAALQRVLQALSDAGLDPHVVSGGSTPAAFSSHLIRGVTEIRPGTYIFNDRITTLTGACGWEDCAYSVLATVVSTAVPGQAVVDAGSKALFREEVRGTEAAGFGALLDRPDVVVSGMSEEHGILDTSSTDWRPRVGDRVRIVPNHVCVSVNLHPSVHGVRGDRIERSWPVAARGWEP
ncbi:MAG TPA: alanine racemase [Longimicrobiales bacterium]|nr:alanine racemase [Longimicrobiales bacterium]